MAEPTHTPFTTPAQRTAVAILMAQRKMAKNLQRAEAEAKARAGGDRASRFFDALASRGVLAKREDGTYGLNR